MRYILKAESDDRRGVRRKLYCITAGSAVILILAIGLSPLRFSMIVFKQALGYVLPNSCICMFALKRYNSNRYKYLMMT
jgi:hypothetical protein